MGKTILFCFVFLSQVLLISWFYPKRFITRGRYMLSAPVTMVSRAIGVHRSLVRPIIRSRLRVIPMGVAALGFVLMAVYPKSSTAM